MTAPQLTKSGRVGVGWEWTVGAWLEREWSRIAMFWYVVALYADDGT